MNYPVQNLILMGLEINADSSAEFAHDAKSSADERREQADFADRDVAVRALVERFGLENVLESIQFAAEGAADAHAEDAELRATVLGLRAVAFSIAAAVKSSKAVRS